MCHALPQRAVAVVVGALALLAVGCGPRTGWRRIEQVCQVDDAPRVCFVAEPDAPLTLEVGGTTLVPGECAQAPKTTRASLKVAVVDGRTGARQRKRVGAGRGRTATVAATQREDGLDVEVSRGRCDR